MTRQQESSPGCAAALSESLRRAAGLLGTLADHCRPGAGDGALLKRLQAQRRELLTAADALSRHRLRVAVVGDFDAGKSTLISALAGRALLPMHPNPATALVTWITHGDQEGYYLCPAGGAAPRTIAGDDFRRFHHGGVEAGQIDHLEAHLPFPLLSRGVVLLDTPGFDNGPDDNARTHAIMSDCSGLILCTPAVHPLSERDLALLASLRPDQVFLVLTFADAGQFEDDPNLMGQLMTGLRTRLMGLGGLEGAAADDLLEHRTVPVSGKLALRARLKQDSEQELASGITVLEERLDRFFLRLEEARMQRARSHLASAVELGQELQQLCQKAESKLKRLDKLLAESQQDFAERLPGVINKRLQGTDLFASANPTRVGLAAITNTVLNRWNSHDQARTAKVLEEAVSELSKRAARQLFSGLVESERLARVAGNLKQALPDLLGEAPVVDEVMGAIGGALERRLVTALLQTPSLAECSKTAPTRLEAALSKTRLNAAWGAMKQTLGSETIAQSDERRRSEIYAGICELVGPAVRSADVRGLVDTVLPGVFAEVGLRLREPISGQVQRWSAELQETIADLEAERRWAESASWTSQ
ncbi:MAG TPA: dynamin family protein [Symbiobacteriaceae bacterium]|nr:dynamin family protein [Symbiobacteriaceae bacterium]